MSAVILLGMGGVDLEVACDFGAGYVDITSYVQVEAGATVSRGRRDEHAQVEPSILQLTVDNADGRFTPANPDGAYWPGVKFRTPIRVRVRHPHTSGTWYTRFTGFVDEWPMNWPGGQIVLAWARVSASSLKRRFARGPQIPGPLQGMILSDSPTVYWPLTDGTEATRAAEAVGTHAIVATFDGPTAPIPGASTGPAGGSQMSLNVSNGGWLGIADMRVLNDLGGDRSLEIWAKLPDAGTHGKALVLYWGDRLGRAWSFSATSDTQVQIEVNGPGPSTYFTVTKTVTGPLFDGNWHQFVVSLFTNALDTRVKFGVDGVATTDGLAVSSGANVSPTHINGGRDLDREINPGTYPDESMSNIGHLVLWDDRILTSQEIADHYTAGIGYVGELAADRFLRLCAEQSVTASATAATGQAMGAQPVGKLVDLLEDCAIAEGGVFYETLAGVFGLQLRTARYNPATHLALSASGQIVDNLAPMVDDQDVVNDATVSRPDGSSARFTDDQSVTDYGTYAETSEVNVATDDVLQQYAMWRVNSSADPSMPRFPTLGFHFAQAADSGPLTSWLTGEPLGLLVTVSDMPSQLANTSEALFLEGYTEHWGHAVMRVAANCSPGLPASQIYVVENGSGDLSRIDLDGVTVTSNITDTATSLSATIAAGDALLTTSPASMKLRNVDTGEIFTVTAVSGASSPQTLTIIRGQDGTTAKAMTATDPLMLAYAPALAL